ALACFGVNRRHAPRKGCEQARRHVVVPDDASVERERDGGGRLRRLNRDRSRGRTARLDDDPAIFHARGWNFGALIFLPATRQRQTDDGETGRCGDCKFPFHFVCEFVESVRLSAARKFAAAFAASAAACAVARRTSLSLRCAASKSSSAAPPLS